jgi:ATP-dependent RNA helicase DDX24/MAK5
MDYNNYPTSGFGAVVDGVDLDAGADVSNWLEFDLHPKLLRALQDMGFTDPTPIQREVLNPAIKGRCDVIGAAETGSGKTLAFGLPILHRLLTQMDAEAEDSDSESGSDSDAKEGGDDLPGDGTNADDGERQKGGSDSESDPFANIVDETGRSGAGAGFRLPKRRKALRALIVAPTRELAMQVCDMLKAVAKYAPEVGITPVVGGMSLQKQERLLRRRPEIVVATPGRLWELMHQQGHEHFLDLGRLNFLVLDEADRMVERGHFAELHNIIDILPMPPRVKRPPGAAKATPETLKVFKKRGPASAPANAGKRGGKGMKGGNAPVVDGDIVEGFVSKDKSSGDGDGEPDGVEISLRPSQMLDRQTFVFSATLTVPDSVRRKLKRGRHVGDGKPGSDKKEKGDKATQTLSGLMEAVPFYGRVKLVDLTDQSRTCRRARHGERAGVHGGRARRAPLPHLDAATRVGDRVRERHLRAPAPAEPAEDLAAPGGGSAREHAAARAAQVSRPLPRRRALRGHRRRQLSGLGHRQSHRRREKAHFRAGGHGCRRARHRHQGHRLGRALPGADVRGHVRAPERPHRPRAKRGRVRAFGDARRAHALPRAASRAEAR